jgi:hypothetical protein
MRELYRDIMLFLCAVFGALQAWAAWRAPTPSDPPIVQTATRHPIAGLIVFAGLLLIAGLLNSAPLLSRLLPKKKDVTQVDQTDWKKLFTEEKKARDVFQKKYSEAANKVLELQTALSQPPTPRLKVISLCDGLRSFLSKYGPIPCVTRNVNEQLDDYFQRKFGEEDTWKSKMAADFRLNFGNGRIEKLCDEVQLSSDLTSSRINTLIASAESPLCDPDTVENIRVELWTLAGKMMSS